MPTNKDLDATVPRGIAILGMVLTFVGGVFVGYLTGGPPPATDVSAAAAAKRVDVPVGLSPTDGPRDALVTIVEFADFQCPFCARSVGLKRQILADYGGRVRWVFKHFPLSIHPGADGVASASLAAHAQGRFWPFRDLLFADRTRHSRAHLIAHAQSVGLDERQFVAALKNSTHAAAVKADVELGKKVGVTGTPTFFVNGRQHRGTISYRGLRALIDQELAYAATLLDSGVRADELYRTLITRGSGASGDTSEPSGGKSGVGEGAKTGRRSPQKAGERWRTPVARDEAKVGELYKVELGDAPVTGPEHAPVTLVVFGHFQCANTAELMRTIDELRHRIGEDNLRVAFKHFPTARHRQARRAAEASLAAGAQGKFWPYAHALLEQGADVPEAVLLRTARELGLEMVRFHSDLRNHTHRDQVRSDVEQAVRLGCIGTPSYFVNGRYGRGARGLPELERLVVPELERAEAALHRGVPASQLYEHLIREGRGSV